MSQSTPKSTNQLYKSSDYTISVHHDLVTSKLNHGGAYKGPVPRLFADSVSCMFCCLSLLTKILRFSPSRYMIGFDEAAPSVQPFPCDYGNAWLGKVINIK